MPERTFGSWMLEKRTALRLKSYEAAKRAGMSPQAWSELENDRTRRREDLPRQLRPDTVRKVAEALEVSEAEAMRIAFPYETQSELIREPIPDNDIEWLGHLGRLSDTLPPGRLRDEYKRRLRADAELISEFLRRLVDGDATPET